MTQKDNHFGMGRRRVAISMVLVAIGILLLATAAYADVKLTAALMSWDDGANKWENGNLTMWLNSDPQPFSEELGFDNDEVPDACGPGTSTKWAGAIALGHDHLDDNGAAGFQSTQDWYAVDCTSFSQLHNTQKYPTDAQKLIACTPDNGDNVIDGCEILSQDVVGPCTPAGRCQEEITTTLQGNLDANCDGTIDDPTIEALVNNNSLCFYWEAVKPPLPGPGDPVWTGNIQSRITSGGGDKTINFGTVLGPNAVTLAGMSATSEISVNIILIMVAMAIVGLLLGLGLRKRQISA